MKKLQSKIDEHFDGGTGSSGPGYAVSVNIPPLSQPPNIRDIYRYRKQRGVNLGSWFTLEDWLTPSLFGQAANPKSSEMDVLKGMGVDDAKEMLEKHWANFVDDGDWQWMTGHGINTVRIPVSYYHFLPGHPDPEVSSLMKSTDYEPFAEVYVNAWKYITDAIQKAAQHQIGVLVDLHSAPGSQNTDAHSGLSTGHAGLWDSDKWQRRTVKILKALAVEVSRFDNVVGLELINEPKDNPHLQAFYDQAIAGIQSVCADMPFYVSDAWATDWYTGYVQQRSNPGLFLVLDHHLYRCFAGHDHSKSASQHAQEVHPSNPHGPSTSMLARISGQTGQSVVIGEWSSALNPASFSSYGSDDEKLAAQREWGHAQWEAYERFCGGYFFWTLKKEGHSDPGWCYYTAVEKGVLPPFNARKPRGLPDFDRGQHECQQAFNSHAGWWDNNSDNPGKFEHWRFQEGFMAAWTDSAAFYQYESELGFVGQWKKLRTEAHKRERGDGEMVWEFEHGYEQGVGKFKEAMYS
jgi:glucan 1,3-beta-glucosidase